MARVTKQEKEAVEWLREWAREGFPRRVDGSFPPDFIAAMYRLCDVTPEQLSYRRFEEALCAGPDFTYLPRRSGVIQWTWDDTVSTREALRG